MSNSFLTMIKTTTIAALLFFSCCLDAAPVLAEGVGDYLILRDIGRYKLTKGIEIRGRIMGAEPSVERSGNEAEGYFISYGTRYVGGEGYTVPSVYVSVYDSTQWMLHDLEKDLKEYENDAATTTNKAAITKIIEGNPIIRARIGGGLYRWISNDKTIEISYHNLHLQYPEPMEVVKEYLKKYPSTLPTTYQIRHPDREKQFIKEEFDRLLWVSERWVSLLKDGDPKNREKLIETADNLEEFANYRKAYFKPLFGHALDKDIELLQTAHMRPGQEEFIRAKLADYQKWWAGHRNSSIDLP